MWPTTWLARERRTGMVVIVLRRDLGPAIATIGRLGIGCLRKPPAEVHHQRRRDFQPEDDEDPEPDHAVNPTLTAAALRPLPASIAHVTAFLRGCVRPFGTAYSRQHDGPRSEPAMMPNPPLSTVGRNVDDEGAGSRLAKRIEAAHAARVTADHGGTAGR